MPRTFVAGIVLSAAFLFVYSNWCFAAPGNGLLARGRTEPVVAVDLRHPSTVVVGSNTNYGTPAAGTYPTAFFFSHNGGRSFVQRNMPQVAPFTTGADPSVVIGGNGVVYYSYLGETPAFCSGGRAAVVLSTSTNGGRTFSTPRIVDVDPADDKPGLAVEASAGGSAHVFVTWTKWHDASSDIWFARSLDGGRTFSHPVMLYSSKSNNFGSVPAVGPHGRVYAFWSTFPDWGLTAVTPTQIIMRASSDDGAHFNPARGVGRTFDAIPRMAAPGSLRNLTGPTVAVDRAGALYIAWAAVTHRHRDGSVDANIELQRSADGGRSWSNRVPVNDDERGDRFMPSLTVLSDRTIGIAFYDRRRSRYNLDLYAVRAVYRARFQLSPNVRINQTTSPISDIYYIAPGSSCFSPGRFFGDYIGTAGAAGGRLAVVWADTQLHTPQETDLWFADVQLPGVITERRRGGRLDAGSTHILRLPAAVK